MVKTVLITGTSSGIGRATAIYFRNKGWQVIATARRPERFADEFASLGIRVLELDVTSEESVRNAAKLSIAEFGKIDVVVNNAGYGLVGVFEASTEEQLRRQFDTNYFGVMRVMRAFLPHFRSNRTGTFVNVSSVGGRFTMPIYSAYHATKFALGGFSESVQFELEPLGIRVKLVEPGPVKTEFTAHSQDISDSSSIDDYASYQAGLLQQYNAKAGQMGEAPIETAKVIFHAATDRSNRLRYTSGRMAKLFLLLNWLLPERITRKITLSMVTS